MNENNLPSREEGLVAQYLKSNRIKFVQQYNTGKLKFDDKSYRKPDFYLPRFGIYVEYLGLYNETREHRGNYEEKRIVYFRNNMPLIELKPHDLGIIDFAFHTKMLHLLRKEKFYSRWKMFRYKLNRYWVKVGLSYFLNTLVFVYLYVSFAKYDSGLSESFHALGSLIAMLALAYNAYRLLWSLMDYFINDL